MLGIGSPLLAAILDPLVTLLLERLFATLTILQDAARLGIDPGLEFGMRFFSLIGRNLSRQPLGGFLHLGIRLEHLCLLEKHLKLAVDGDGMDTEAAGQDPRGDERNDAVDRLDVVPDLGLLQGKNRVELHIVFAKIDRIERGSQTAGTFVGVLRSVPDHLGDLEGHADTQLVVVLHRGHELRVRGAGTGTRRLPQHEGVDEGADEVVALGLLAGLS